MKFTEGNRKFIKGGGALIVLAVLQWFGKLPDDTFLWSFSVLISSFMGGNALEHLANAFGGRGKPGKVLELAAAEPPKDDPDE